MSSPEAEDAPAPEETPAAEVAPPAKSTSAVPLTALLLLACGALGLYAAFGSPPAPGVTSSNSDAAPANSPGAQHSPGAEPPPGHPPIGHGTAPPAGSEGTPQAGTLGGVVKEVLQVSSYTYLLLAPDRSEPFWAAVTKTNVPVGTPVHLEGAELMTNFSSKELGRTFERIYFARLSSGAGLDPKAGGEFPAPTAQEGAAAKRAASLVAEEIPVEKTPRAAGNLGRSVEEIYQKRNELRGTRVRVRGTIVKVTRQVMGTNFLHVRDGTGDAGAGSHDLTLKLDEEPPKLGEVAEFEGTVASDVDLGAGYSYSVLLEDARMVRP